MSFPCIAAMEARERHQLLSFYSYSLENSICEHLQPEGSECIYRVAPMKATCYEQNYTWLGS